MLVTRFLQAPQSPIPLQNDETLNEHGVAAITCLLSGLHIFENSYPERSRFLRLIEGIHGFHIYATEYWTEYVLAHVAWMATVPGTTSSRLLSLALQFAARVELIATDVKKQKDILTDEQSFDDRLSFLQQYPQLKDCVLRNLQARSLEKLESDLAPQATSTFRAPDSETLSTKKVPADRVLDMLNVYQCSLRFLLEQDYYPGVSAMEFERFKSQFGTAAFTCRLASCPWATVGFSSGQRLWKHEMSHVQHFPCTAVGCQYPPFSTAEGLRNHKRKCHPSQLPRMSIQTERDTTDDTNKPKIPPTLSNLVNDYDDSVHARNWPDATYPGATEDILINTLSYKDTQKIMTDWNAEVNKTDPILKNFIWSDDFGKGIPLDETRDTTGHTGFRLASHFGTELKDVSADPFLAFSPIK